MRMLLVEDDPNMQTLLAFALPDVEIHEAWTLHEADDAFDACHPDIVVTDVRLPDGDGVDFVEHLRHDRAYSAPIIVLTSGHREAERGAVFDRGADEYLCKAEELKDIRALRARRLRICAMPADARRSRRAYLAARALAGESGELDPPNVDALVGPAPVLPRPHPRRFRKPEPWF